MSVALPADLRDRARKLANRLHSSINQLLREGLRKKCDEIEAHFRAEEERKRERETSKSRLRGLRARSISPIAAEPDPESEEEKFYRALAERVAEVVDAQPTEAYLRAQEAVRAVRRQFPLTCPRDDREILARIEAGVRRIRAERVLDEPVALAAPPPPPSAAAPAAAPPWVAAIAPAPMRAADEMTGRRIDPTRTKSYGNVGGADEET